MELSSLVRDIADTLAGIDSTCAPFKHFKTGIGPYGEPQLLGLIRDRLNLLPAYRDSVVTKRTPDLLLRGYWALEFKIVRPFGDNGKPAEDWSVNLLHPYRGNISAIGDCYKLLELPGLERKAVIVIGFEHSPPQVDLEPLLAAFEAIITCVTKIKIGPRCVATREALVHPVHQQLVVVAWEVVGAMTT